jgi:glyoxylase-like metal-dependent hydrolase (beta-lactamase superfamily II)
MNKIACLIISVLFCGVAIADDLFEFQFEEIATDVWVGVRPDGPRFPVMGNTTFVISSEGVVVFDGGGAPAMADQLIEKIRSLTDKPVTHVVTSHWHGDHNFGVYRFAEEFDNVQFIAHRFTAEVMDSPRIAYIDFSPTFYERNAEVLEATAETGKDAEGNEVTEQDRLSYVRMLADRHLIEPEYQRLRVTPPNVIFDDSYTIQSGDRTIELLHLGHANTAGDIVMWLADEKIVATGDIVVLPTPYAFNVPPRPWAQTLRNIKDLDYDILVPGHGEIQRDTQYVDLIIEAANSIADQRDRMIAEGMSAEDVETALDFSAFEERFTGGDDYLTLFYDQWYEGPFRSAAMKALTGEPMVNFAKPESVPFDDERWQIEAESSERLTHLGQEALKIQGGTAVIAGTDIDNGIVEFDIATTGERGFAGLVFRQQDAQNYEHFYIRPHQSGKPDANQYTPVFNGVSAWQLYHGDGYGTPVTYKNDEWMHIKVVFAGTRADVYIDSEKPVMRVSDLKRETAAGLVGVNAANFAPAYFANVRISTLAKAYELPQIVAPSAEMPEGRIRAWDVSGAFDSSEIASSVTLDQSMLDSQSWTSVDAEISGITNLAATGSSAGGPNTKFARLIIESDHDRLGELKLGYSDAAMVFVNGDLQYRGDNTYMSRDFRYLGTIGLFDTVVLPLVKGENEICIAVTEAFGGWGVMAELADLDGVSISKKTD